MLHAGINCELIFFFILFKNFFIMKINFKKTLLSTFILIELTALCSYAACPVFTGNDTPVSTGLRVKVSVSFEIARRRDCSGFGICNFEVGITYSKTNSCVANLYIDETSKNVYVLEIDKAKVSAANYDKYFKSGYFLMEDEAAVPTEALRTLGTSGTKTMLAGKHLVTERNGFLYVAIPVK